MIITLLADGFEEIEALTPVDMLRRAGFEVKIVAVSGKAPVGAHGIPVVCDATADEIDLSKVNMVILPGGMPGTLNLDDSPFTNEVLRAVIKNGGRIAAICAAPLILGRRGLLEGKKATCYPGFENELIGATVTQKGVVTDGNITTARGMGVALEFAEELVSLLAGKEKAQQISVGICKKSINELLADAKREYVYPNIDLLKNGESIDENFSDELEENANIIVNTLNKNGAPSTVRSIDRGPRVTRFEIVPEKGVKVSKILKLQDDILLNLGVSQIRMEAPIPGKSSIGIEVPNKKASVVRLRDLLESEEFKSSSSKTAVCIGRDVSGNPIIGDIAKMPHLLVGGAVGMGKSVFINSLIISMLFKAGPDDLKLIMFDPKQVEYTMYKNLPHLMLPIIHDAKQAASALEWLRIEMERRFQLLVSRDCRNANLYNEKIASSSSPCEKLPAIVFVFDEFADIMADRKIKETVEQLIMYIGSRGRATGIHLIIGTQRPSVNTITGLIKANIPSRICFKVMSNSESKTLLDCSGGEKLLDRGDALYAPMGSTNPVRVQTAFISDNEVMEILNYIKSNNDAPCPDEQLSKDIDSIEKQLFKPETPKKEETEPYREQNYLNNEQFLNAVELAIMTGKVSTSLIQRKLMIGYGKAAKFIDVMEEMGIIDGVNGQAPRKTRITHDEWREKMGGFPAYSEKSEHNEVDEEEELKIEAPFLKSYIPTFVNTEKDKDTDNDIIIECLCNEQFLKAVELTSKCSSIHTGLLQRKLSIGYGKAAKFIDVMENMGIISEPNGQSPRKVLITADAVAEKILKLRKEYGCEDGVKTKKEAPDTAVGNPEDVASNEYSFAPETGFKLIDEEKICEAFHNDQLFLDAVELAVNTRKISTSLIQRNLSVGYGKAAKFIDAMEDMGIVGPANGARPREVLLTPEQWREKLARISDND